MSFWLGRLRPPPVGHFGTAQQKRLCEQGLSKLFERGKGSPGVLLPMCRRLFAASTHKGPSTHKGRIEPEQVGEVLHRWDLA